MEHKDFISLVKRMRDAQKEVIGYNILVGAEKFKELWADVLENKIKLEQEVDKYLEKMEEKKLINVTNE